ncbi:MAG: class I SAM-dependent methyltransferase [Xanthomonadales bacterium]|nr:class I SAM-dependent methyltransferase [Xanthomonadales bacterium]
MRVEQIAPTELSAAWVEPGARTWAFGVVPAYRRYELRQARYRDMVPAAQALADQVGHLDVLDIGSGTGSAKRFLDHAGIEASWTGVEIDPRRVRLCRALGYDRILDDLDLERSSMPFADESFDFVIASHIIEHLRDDRASLADWFRLLRPGGCLILGVPMHLPFIAALAKLRYRLVGRRAFGHCQFYSMRTLKALLRPYRTRAIRGFRIFSARKWLSLEDQEWFFRASLRMGHRYPALTQEVNVEIVKPE